MLWTIWRREAVLGGEPRASNMLTKFCATELHPQVFKGFVISFLVIDMEPESLFVSTSFPRFLYYQFIYFPSCQSLLFTYSMALSI